MSGFRLGRCPSCFGPNSLSFPSAAVTEAKCMYALHDVRDNIKSRCRFPRTLINPFRPLSRQLQYKRCLRTPTTPVFNLAKSLVTTATALVHLRLHPFDHCRGSPEITSRHSPLETTGLSSVQFLTFRDFSSSLGDLPSSTKPFDNFETMPVKVTEDRCASIICQELFTCIDVTAKDGQRTVSVNQIFEAVYAFLHEKANKRALRLSEYANAPIYFFQRMMRIRDPALRSVECQIGIKNVDLLCGRHWFQGLEESDMYERTWFLILNEECPPDGWINGSLAS